MASKNFYSEGYWQIKIQKWLSSGQNAKSWCRENQIVYNTFLGWRKRLSSCLNQKAIRPSKQKSLERASSKEHFVELKNEPKSNPGIYLECNGVQIHLCSEFDASILIKCLNIVREAAC